jgi:hypothetical protein
MLLWYKVLVVQDKKNNINKTQQKQQQKQQKMKQHRKLKR